MCSLAEFEVDEKTCTVIYELQNQWMVSLAEHKERKERETASLALFKSNKILHVPVPMKFTS